MLWYGSLCKMFLRFRGDSWMAVGLAARPAQFPPPFGSRSHFVGWAGLEVAGMDSDMELFGNGLQGISSGFGCSHLLQSTLHLLIGGCKHCDNAPPMAWNGIGGFSASFCPFCGIE